MALPEFRLLAPKPPGTSPQDKISSAHTFLLNEDIDYSWYRDYTEKLCDHEFVPGLTN